ncbi:MAG: hypothetical protein ABI867_36365 [Kofleriaceae bacterium]
MLRLLVVSCSSGCILPYAIPPLKGEVGATTLRDDPAFHVAGGTSVASGMIDRAAPVDVGVGGFLESSEAGVLTHGAYADAAIFIDKSHHARTAIGARGELRYTPDGRGLGAKLRIDHEVFAPTKRGYSGSDRCGFIAGAAHGMGAVGFYAEAGHVWQPNDEHAWVAGAGLTVRIPATLGFIVGIPWCK